ncbi:MAG: sensor protein KdpD [Chitinophagaceae bacterium]
MPSDFTDHEPDRFLDLIRSSRKGKFRIYIGMAAGVGKTYRMLQDAHALMQNGVEVKLGFVETHDRPDTAALLYGLTLIPNRKVFYKGKALEEMDLQQILNLHPEVVIVDELAHTNIPGSKHEKRWQDVMEILDAGINVISALNIQHLEHLGEIVKQITGVEVSERIPDHVLMEADEIVNIDLTADDLISRLKAGKIYKPDKVERALSNFFQPEHILQLRELALKEVAGQVERRVDLAIPKGGALRHERFMACIGSNERTARAVVRKTARLAGYYNAQWFVLFVETPRESSDKIALDKQRHLINNFKLATELGAKVLKVQHTKVANGILQVVEDHAITTVCIGKPHLSLLQIILATGVFKELLNALSVRKIDLVILS